MEHWEKICKRTIKRSKYSTQSPENKKWWKQTFEKVENDVKKKFNYLDLTLIEDFPFLLLDDLKRILGRESDEDEPKILCEERRPRHLHLEPHMIRRSSSVDVQADSKNLSDSSFVSTVTTDSSISKAYSIKTFAHKTDQINADLRPEPEPEPEPEQELTSEEKLKQEAIEVESASSNKSSLEDLEVDERRFTFRTDTAFMKSIINKSRERTIAHKEKVAGPEMYKKFFSQSPEKAAVWRPQPPPSYEEMTLSQRANFISEKIATDFVEWMEDLGGNYKVNLTPENVMKMFEIGCQSSTARTLDMKMVEMPSVPKKVAVSRKVPQYSVERVLNKEIEKDLKASKRQPKLYAFGSTIPQEMQVRPTLNEVASKWHKCDKVRDDLISMSTVWEGITHLKSTREFCEYLKTNKPEVDPPQYLVEAGMFNRGLTKKDSIISADKISINDNEL